MSVDGKKRPPADVLADLQSLNWWDRLPWWVRFYWQIRLFDWRLFYRRFWK